MILFDSWLSGAWSSAPEGAAFVPGTSIVYQDSLKDINGATLTVGATVKFVGKVTALNANDQHFADVTVTAISPDPMTARTVGIDDQFIKRSVHTFHPMQLVVGS